LKATKRPHLQVMPEGSMSGEEERRQASENGLFSGRSAVMPHVVERMAGRVRDVHVECECKFELFESSSEGMLQGMEAMSLTLNNSRTYPWAALLKVNGDVAIKTESDGGGDFKSHRCQLSTMPPKGTFYYYSR